MTATNASWHTDTVDSAQGFDGARISGPRWTRTTYLCLTIEPNKYHLECG